MLRHWARLAIATCVCAFGLLAVAADPPKPEPIVGGLENPESVVMTDDGRIFVTAQGRMNADGDGRVMLVVGGEAKTFAEGFNDPKGIDKRGNDLFVADKNKVWKIDSAGKATVYAPTDKFPQPPRLLNDISVGPNGDVFVSDLMGGVVFQIKPSQEVVVAVDSKRTPSMRSPNGVLADGPDHVIVCEFSAGKAIRVKLDDGSAKELASGLGAPDGIARDAKGRLVFTDNRGGRVLRLEPGATEPTVILSGITNPADCNFHKDGRLLIPQTRLGTLVALSLD